MMCEKDVRGHLINEVWPKAGEEAILVSRDGKQRRFYRWENILVETNGLKRHLRLTPEVVDGWLKEGCNCSFCEKFGPAPWGPPGPESSEQLVTGVESLKSVFEVKKQQLKRPIFVYMEPPVARTLFCKLHGELVAQDGSQWSFDFGKCFLADELNLAVLRFRRDR